MALRVWLPLLGNFKNHGAANIPAISLVSGNSWASSGKIGGQSLQITKQQSILGTSSCMTGKKQMSYAFWVKVNTAWSAQWLDGIAWYSTDGSNAAYSRQEFYTNCTRVGTWFSGSSLSGYVFTPGEWTHLAGTFDYTAGVAKFYINGILQGTSTALSKTHSCRGDFYIGDSGIDIVENDVRIYDHCLSQAEIKELARGLILHYPLNRNGWGQENLLKNSGDLTLWNKESGINCEYDSTVNMYKIYSTTRESSRWGIYQDYAVTVNTDTNYTFSLTGKTDGYSAYLSFGAGTGWPTNYIAFTSNKQRLSKTLTIPAGTTNIRVYLAMYPQTGGGHVYFEKPKLEESSIATPWCPNSSDTLATTMGLNSTTEYDCSGFCNNGTRTGTFTWTSDTPKYQVSSKIAAASTGIKTSNFYIGDVWSMSVWFKYPSQDSSGWKALVILNNNGGDADLQFGNYINCNSNTIQYSANGKYTTGVTFTYGEWHHIVNTYDGTTLKCYLDGVYKTSVTPGQTLSRSNLGIGFKSSSVDFSSVGSSFTNGFLSDVRIYATALSADDVKSLYQNEAFIDSSGTIYGQIR